MGNFSLPKDDSKVTKDWRMSRNKKKVSIDPKSHTKEIPAERNDYTSEKPWEYNETKRKGKDKQNLPPTLRTEGNRWNPKDMPPHLSLPLLGTETPFKTLNTFFS
jgi:hypothetical protein